MVSHMVNGPLGGLFDHQQLITDVSGSGNNWATGHMMYGPKYREQITETVRKAAEICDCLQCFFILHSMGGGQCLHAVCKVPMIPLKLPQVAHSVLF